jgi:hypothetical protein
MGLCTVTLWQKFFENRVSPMALVIFLAIFPFSILGFDSFGVETSFFFGLSALLVPQVLQKSNFSPSTVFSLKLVPKHLIRSTYRPWHRFLTGFFTFLCHAGKFLSGFYQRRLI